MTNVEMISMVLKVITCLVAVFYMIFPEKLKRNTLSPLKLRLILGTVLFLLIGSMALSYFVKSQAGVSPDLNAEQKAKINEVEGKLQTKLSNYPEEAKTHKFTLLCKDENKKNILLQTPNMPDQTAELIGLAVCSCIYEKAKDMPEFAKMNSLLSSGKNFIEAMNESFQSAEQVMKIAETCSDI